MDAREALIAHMPLQAQELMRHLWEQLDEIDRDLGLAPPKETSGLAIDVGWKRRPPRDNPELSERLQQRETARAPIIRMITHWATMFPAPMPPYSFQAEDNTGGSALSRTDTKEE